MLVFKKCWFVMLYGAHEFLSRPWRGNTTSHVLWDVGFGSRGNDPSAGSPTER